MGVGVYLSGSTCVVDGHKGKAAAAWGKLKLNSLEGKAKVVRGCLSNRISSLKEHNYDMVGDSLRCGVGHGRGFRSLLALS